MPFPDDGCAPNLAIQPMVSLRPWSGRWGDGPARLWNGSEVWPYRVECLRCDMTSIDVQTRRRFTAEWPNRPRECNPGGPEVTLQLVAMASARGRPFHRGTSASEWLGSGSLSSWSAPHDDPERVVRQWPPKRESVGSTPGSRLDDRPEHRSAGEARGSVWQGKATRRTCLQSQRHERSETLIDGRSTDESRRRRCPALPAVVRHLHANGRGSEWRPNACRDQEDRVSEFVAPKLACVGGWRPSKPDRPADLELPAGNPHRELELRFH